MGVFRAAASTTGPGVVFGAIGGSFMSGQAGTVEFCDAVGGAADTDAAYRPGCSNGGSFFGAGGTDFRYIEAETLVEATGAQRHGFGVNVQSVGTPEIDGAVGALTFTTAGTPGASASPAPVLGTTARVVGARVKVKSGKARVPVHCSGPGSCHVRVAIANSRAKGKALIRAGATRMVTVKLTNALRKRLKRSRSVKATLVLEVSGAAGQATQVTRTRVKLSGS
jgi:hypothetical protein